MRNGHVRALTGRDADATRTGGLGVIRHPIVFATRGDGTNTSMFPNRQWQINTEPRCSRSARALGS